ncbi:hypothetical protein PanWU01x14_016390, partial [Parasponia andersonii]
MAEKSIEVRRLSASFLDFGGVRLSMAGNKASSAGCGYRRHARRQLVTAVHRFGST